MEQEPLAIEGIDSVHFVVGNARQAAHFYQSGFGFDITAYAGPETGQRESSSWVVQQGEIRFVFTAALSPDHPYADHVHRHGDGVKDIAFRVADAAAAYEAAVARGARGVVPPYMDADEAGPVRLATIGAYGDTTHTFVERHAYQGAYLPGYEPVSRPGVSSGLHTVDHIVANVELGQMDTWVDFYRRVMGFDLFVSFDDKDISTEYSALMSKVMADGAGRVKLPINEPAPGKRKSQIDEYLEFYRGPGVQHLALRTDDIIQTVTELKRRGIAFLTVPDSYYRLLPERVGAIDENLTTLKELGVLVDRDEEGYLLQIFTQPVQDRPTAFYEIIQRKGAQGFGKGNFKALFEAIEREQARRGNL